MSQLTGKVIVQGDIETLTGLRVGGTSGGLKIGGVDLNVITDPWGKPYIPGSSLKGKTRSLMESYCQKAPNHNGIHLCQTEAEYAGCPVCKVWGIMGDARNFSHHTLTRLLIKDVYLDESSVTTEMRKNLELQWTEVKMETSINRLTGTAQHGSLRQIERVPAGAVFKDAQFIFNVFESSDKELLKNLFIALELVENDYLGGMGSRGFGRVRFFNLAVYWNNRESYENGEVGLDPSRVINNGADIPESLVKNFSDILQRLN